MNENSRKDSVQPVGKIHFPIAEFDANPVSIGEQLTPSLANTSPAIEPAFGVASDFRPS